MTYLSGSAPDERELEDVPNRVVTRLTDPVVAVLRGEPVLQGLVFSVLPRLVGLNIQVLDAEDAVLVLVPTGVFGETELRTIEPYLLDWSRPDTPIRCTRGRTFERRTHRDRLDHGAVPAIRPSLPRSTSRLPPWPRRTSGTGHVLRFHRRRCRSASTVGACPRS